MTPAHSLYEALYVSTLAPDQPPSVVAEIAGRARVKNASLGITGLLVFDGMRFCQQLEGTQKEVLKLTERIRNDPRHTGVEVLHHGLLAERRFRQFSLAFTSVDDPDALARMEQLDGEAALAAFEVLRGDLEP
ncbi:BLUF domain-containing protein [Acidovorax sp.]|uniref:BLUF domain-containing protein n=1 Tax=Acidovorax sp. TaxID=1872122 RepID=UPI002ACE9757|nr:BLUF domain-containing protein [Acidovorax sp.]MDZ7866989.1 BLUF domain-containing protein [Acidovorax sp.]